MKKEEIFEIVEKQGYKLIPQNDTTFLKLIVKGDENDGDYITRTYHFGFTEIDKVFKIKEELLKLPSYWYETYDFENDDEDEDENEFDITEYIPSGSSEYVHTIEQVHIQIVIDGLNYNIKKQ